MHFNNEKEKKNIIMKEEIFDELEHTVPPCSNLMNFETFKEGVWDFVPTSVVSDDFYYANTEFVESYLYEYIFDLYNIYINSSIFSKLEPYEFTPILKVFGNILSASISRFKNPIIDLVEPEPLKYAMFRDDPYEPILDENGKEIERNYNIIG